MQEQTKQKFQEIDAILGDISGRLRDLEQSYKQDMKGMERANINAFADLMEEIKQLKDLFLQQMEIPPMPSSNSLKSEDEEREK